MHFLKSGRRVSRVWRTVCNSAALLSCCLTLHAADPRVDSGASIPREGLALWLTAGDTEIEEGTVKAIKDHSGKKNDAVRKTDPKIVPGNPTVVRAKKRGQDSLFCSSAEIGFLLGRPRARSVDSRSSRRAIDSTQFACPKGLLRRIAQRTASSSLSLSGSLTRRIQLAERGNGQGDNSRGRSSLD